MFFARRLFGHGHKLQGETAAIVTYEHHEAEKHTQCQRRRLLSSCWCEGLFHKKNWWARPSNIKKISKLYCPRGKMKVTIKWRSKGEWNSRGFEFLSQRHFHSKTCFYKKWLLTWPPFFAFFTMILEARFRPFRLIFRNKMAAIVLIILYRSRLGPPGV